MEFSETQKRLKIAENISPQLEGIVRGVLLGGSMGYGQNYSVTKNSDIDMVIVCDEQKIRELERTPYFYGQIPKSVLRMFENRTINLFWVTKQVNSVEVNSFVYETEGFEQFCALKGRIKGYIPTKPSETQTQYGFDGNEITFNRNVTPCENGFLYEKPALVNGKFWGGPPRSDFLIGSCLLYQKDSFFDKIGEKVWDSVLRQLIKEYGPNPNLDKVNVLNTEFSYQRKPEKLPPGIAERVQEKTRRLLNEYLSLDK
jgi:hypothetical protein